VKNKFQWENFSVNSSRENIPHDLYIRISTHFIGKEYNTKANNHPQRAEKDSQNCFAFTPKVDKSLTYIEYLEGESNFVEHPPL